jgi:hypothetical protein
MRGARGVSFTSVGIGGAPERARRPNRNAVDEEGPSTKAMAHDLHHDDEAKQIVGDAIRVAQQKTAAKLTIPIHEVLDRVLSTANRSHSTILVAAYGERFSVKGFGQMISTAIP